MNTSALALESGGNLATIAGAVRAEDAASADGHTGIPALAVRKGTPANTSGTDGDYENLQVSAGRLWVDASGKTLTVDGSGVTQPVSGSVTVTQGTGSNLHTVIDSGTVSTITNVVHVDDNSGSLTVDGTVTASIAAGATTIAKAEDVASADADVGVPAMAVRKASPANTSGTDGDYEMLQMSAGRLWASSTIDAALPAGSNAIGKLAANDGVDIGDVSINGGTVAHDGVGTSVNPVLNGAYASAAAPSDVSADGDAVRLWALRSGAQAVQPTFAGILGVAGNGVAGTGVQRVTIASDSTGNIATIGTSVTPGTGASNLGKAEDAGHSSADVGVMALGVRESSPTDLSAGNTNGDYEPFQVAKEGGVWVSQAATGGGGGVSVATGSIAATKTDIGTANTAGQVFGWYFYNPNASVAYVQFFNTQASGVTLGTTAPVYSLGIPATSGANVMNPMGIVHSTAISIAVTTTRAGSTGTGSTVDYNIYYKQ